MGQDPSKRVWDTDAERERKRAYRERQQAKPKPPPCSPPPVLSKTAYPHVVGRDPESSWTLKPTPERLARLHDPKGTK